MLQDTFARDIAWASGVFEGEGCIHVYSDHDHSVRLVVNMTDQDVVERLGRIFRVGQVREVAKHKTWQSH